MSWVAVGLTAGTAALNYKQAKDQQKQQKIDNDLQAQLESTSWATGRGGTASFKAENPYTALLEGGVQGAMTGIAQNQNIANAKTKEGFNQANKPFSIYSQLPDMKLKTGY